MYHISKQRSPQNIEPDKENSNNNELGFFMDKRPPNLSSSVVSCAVPVGNVVPRGTELELQLRRGVRQAAHICNNLHVKSTGVY